MTHKGFYTDITNGEPVYRCCRCPYTVFETERMRFHQEVQHKRIVLPDVVHVESPIEGKKIAICFLTWNTANASASGADAIVGETLRLASLGVKSHVFWVDNGSTDGTVGKIYDIFGAGLKVPVDFMPNTINEGQCKGRNRMIDGAKSAGCDFLAMIDGDVTIIPFSLHTMAVDLSMLGSWINTPIGCLGLYSANWTNDIHDPELSMKCTHIPPDCLHDDMPIAWTQYGVYPMSVFHDGCRFDESGPFAGPGWGFEDDDLGLQLLNAGYCSLNTKLFRYLHQRNSSWKSLGDTLVTEVSSQRRSYIIDKWRTKDHPVITRYVRQLQGQNILRPAATV